MLTPPAHFGRSLCLLARSFAFTTSLSSVVSVCCGRLKPLPVRLLIRPCERRGNESSHCLMRKPARSCPASTKLCRQGLLACSVHVSCSSPPYLLKAGSREWGQKPLVRVSFLCGSKQWYTEMESAPRQGQERAGASSDSGGQQPGDPSTSQLSQGTRQCCPLRSHQPFLD